MLRPYTRTLATRGPQYYYNVCTIIRATSKPLALTHLQLVALGAQRERELLEHLGAERLGETRSMHF